MSGKRYSPEEIVGIFESKASAAWQKMRAKLVNTGFYANRVGWSVGRTTDWASSPWICLNRPAKAQVWYRPRIGV